MTHQPLLTEDATLKTARARPRCRSCPTLLSYERSALVTYLLASVDNRRLILEAAKRDPQVSGSLIIAFEWLLSA